MTGGRIFTTVAEARTALKNDRLASVWFRAGSVFVATAHGTGTFTREEWERGDGPRNSIVLAFRRPDGPVPA